MYFDNRLKIGLCRCVTVCVPWKAVPFEGPAEYISKCMACVVLQGIEFAFPSRELLLLPITSVCEADRCPTCSPGKDVVTRAFSLHSGAFRRRFSPCRSRQLRSKCPCRQLSCQHSSIRSSKTWRLMGIGKEDEVNRQIRQEVA